MPRKPSSPELVDHGDAGTCLCDPTPPRAARCARARTRAPGRTIWRCVSLRPVGAGASTTVVNRTHVPLFRPSQPAATILRSSGHGRYLSSPRPPCSTSRIARQVSRPIRSASASGPIGWFMPSFITVSIASGVADAFHQAVDRLVDHRHQDAVRHEARDSRSLPPASCPAPARARPSRPWSRRVVASPRMTSTSCITGTGFMKCMPITGRDASCARRSR